MKNFFVAAMLLVACSCFAQKKVTGFYKGTLFNDSTKMVQQYELALAQYRGKIMGYSYVTFVANDTFYYGIRKIKAKIVGDSLVVEDDKMVANNFPEAPAKRVNRTVTIPFNGQDSLVSIDGRWTTNKTKFYYSVPGSVEAAKSDDSSSSALFAHLRELNLMPNENYAVTQEDERKQKVADEQRQPSNTKDVAVAKDKSKTKHGQPLKEGSKNPVAAVLPYNERKDHVHQTLDVTSDSLTLSFYDNGVVDGDEISVYLNDTPVITKARLTSVATKKTIYVGDNAELKLMLVAETLGSIPPNTGLLTIRDGDKTFQVNFTADMQTNASIVLRRKSKQ